MEASDADFAAAASSLDESELLSSFMWAAGEPGSDRQAEGQSWVDDESIDIDLRPVHLRTGDGLVGGIRPVGEVSLLQADLTKSLRPRRTCCRPLPLPEARPSCCLSGRWVVASLCCLCADLASRAPAPRCASRRPSSARARRRRRRQLARGPAPRVGSSRPHRAAAVASKRIATCRSSRPRCRSSRTACMRCTTTRGAAVRPPCSSRRPRRRTPSTTGLEAAGSRRRRCSRRRLDSQGLARISSSGLPQGAARAAQPARPPQRAQRARLAEQ